MPRYYSDVRSHFAALEDPEGLELPDIAAAKAVALKRAEKLLEKCTSLPSHYSGAIAIEIVDQNLNPVPAIPYIDLAVQKPSMS